MSTDVSAPLVSEAQRAAFRLDGCLFLPGFFDATEVAAVTRWTEEVTALPERAGTHMVYYEDSLIEPGRRVLSRIENFCPYHPAFDALMRRGRMSALVDTLLAEPCVLFKEKINFKLPGSDGFKAHQDVQAGWDAYASLHVTVLVSVDPTTEENGYLELAPGIAGHRLLGDMWRPLTDDEVPGEVYRPYPTAPGDVLVFDSYIPHRSAPNRTGQPRRVLYVTYNRRSEGDHRERYYADKRKSYPPDCEREPGQTYRFRV